MYAVLAKVKFCEIQTIKCDQSRLNWYCCFLQAIIFPTQRLRAVIDAISGIIIYDNQVIFSLCFMGPPTKI